MQLTVPGYHSEDLLYKGSPPIPPFPGCRAPHWHLIPLQSQLKKENPQHMLTDIFLKLYYSRSLGLWEANVTIFPRKPPGPIKTLLCDAAGRSRSSRTANGNEKSPQSSSGTRTDTRLARCCQPASQAAHARVHRSGPLEG